MAAPATTGVLRTNIADMQIGDYIACEFDSSVAGGLLTLNKTTGGSGEAPLTGFTGNNKYFFYFVKTNKGLLIADRVVYHTYNWDAMNTQKNVQGRTWTYKAHPTMTSATTPEGIVTCNKENVGVEAWKAFNQVTSANDGSDAWGFSSVATEPGWVAYESTSPKMIIQYGVRTHYSAANPNTYAPKNWTFEGWNGTDWEVLDTQVNQTGWGSGTQIRYFNIANPKLFSKYRLHITANNGSANNNTLVGEIEMLEGGIIRSLTGGVAYADVNGNALTNRAGTNFGSFPTNNEFDKYVLNFPSNLIQSGKIIDDVFHCSRATSMPYTWCQDTPANGVIHAVDGTTNIGTNTRRTVRAIFTEHSFSAFLSTTSDANTGFRPVFEYREV